MTEEIPRKAEGKTVSAKTVSLQCPDCGHLGTFEPVQDLEDFHLQTTWTEPSTSRQPGPKRSIMKRAHWKWGQRRCPRLPCHAHVFVILKDDEVVTSYPPQRIDFDKEGIPNKITQTLEEAITCHAQQCYVAAAIMVRRTLEEICADRGATGDSLWKRIRKLKANVIISEGLLEGMGNLILLGNDAAHVEARAFEQVSKEEVQLGIEITKEILKAVYQEKNLVERLNRLKRTTQ